MTEQDTEHFTCRRCNNKQPASFFRIRPDRTNYRVKSCKECVKSENRELNQMHKIVPPKPNSCDCCGKTSSEGRLYLDHCHKNLTFRGWLCNSCNLGIGSLGDSVSGLEIAISYLKREGKHDSI